MGRSPAAGRAAQHSCRVEVRGTVQGVGFRPYVYRLARSLGLRGSVRNAGGNVIIEAIGAEEALAALVRRLPAEAPPQAVVTQVLVAERAVAGTDLAEEGTTGENATEEGAAEAVRAGAGFRVLESHNVPGTAQRQPRLFPPDIATCERCLQELFDPADRRYRYPFTNCTDCGPRATIIDTLPYDRARTTMAPFPLCPDCAAEYADPGDRRFHAEPVACPACGPRLAWEPASAGPAPAEGEHALAAAVAVVANGGLIALKGLGGYQLVCDATNEEAVRSLRERKRRPSKPFAVMVADLPAARKLADLEPVHERLLAGTVRPIVLSDALLGVPLAASVHPGTDQLGLFLPYTPLHHLLLHDLDRPLVVTSGNLSDEPIAIDDDHATGRLGSLVDGFLRHDRAIRARFDDSVSQVVAGRPAVVRRARGYAPAPIRLPLPAHPPLLAVGAQLKHTFALADGERVIMSPHLGDLSDADTFDAFEQGLAHLSRLSGITPEIFAHDLHPGYLSTQYARRHPASVAVQHHHAHVASCAAEHGLTEAFIGVAYDGLGLGGDGSLWGGEIMVADLAHYLRVGRFGRAPLPGGEAAIRRPARMALAYLFGAERLGPTTLDQETVSWFTDQLPDREVEVIRRMLARSINSPPASSAGRLFDAVASLLRLCDDASFEGQAAIALESTAAQLTDIGPVAELPWRIVRRDGLSVYDPAPTVAAVVAGAAAGQPAAVLAAAFHTTMVAVTTALCAQARKATGLRTVCLSGGVFQNRLLTCGLRDALSADGFEVYTNEQVPANDGGISYGQAAVAAARTATRASRLEVAGRRGG